MATRNEELENFKTQINLCEYAGSVGFIFDRKASSRCSAVMRHTNGDKIVVARTSSRHWVYFNVHGSDSGTIIDFVQARQRNSLGAVRVKLRPWIGRTKFSQCADTQPIPIDLEPSEHDAAKVLGSWMKAAQVSDRQPYLFNDRLIPSSVLADPIFKDRIRIDARSNVLFPHWNQHGSLCGFELKNRGFTGFAPGGVKGLWCSRPRPNDKIMILAETAIDALSFAALNRTDGKRFFSTAGQISPTQAECIRSAVSNMPLHAEIWLAFDNDDGGKALSRQVQAAVADLSGNKRTILECFPTCSGDWNDVLRNQAQAKPQLPRHG